MGNYPSPGVLWAFWLVVSALLIINRYKSGIENFFRFGWAYIFILFLFFLCGIYTYYTDKSKSQAMAIASFIFGLAVFIPLLNLVFAIPAVYLGIASIKRIKQNPQRFGGKWFAVAGIILGMLVYITYITGLGLCLIGLKEICINIGLAFLAK